MRMLNFLLIILLVLLNLEELCYGEILKENLSRDDFPKDFVFGAGTSAYQWEGAVAEDGRSPSIWDTYTHAGKMIDKSNGDVACDGYHKYKNDVKLMSDTGLDSFRFSISWSRLLPNGRGEVNPKGLEFYNNLINELLKHGIEPKVSLYHLDFPQVLEDEYGGWISPKVVDDFTEYADVCFKEFGDRVSQWTTSVEPNVIAMAAYDTGFFPPCRCSYPFGINCTVGDSTTEPYIAVHNMILAHASAVELYRKKYQAIQRGSIGFNVYSFWMYPFSNSTEDVEATQRAIDFMIGWILNPLVFGNYPKVMRRIVGSRLPSFTKKQSKLIKGSYDFIGLNHYTSVYVKDNANASEFTIRDFNADMSASLAGSRNETPTGSQYFPSNLPFDPAGLRYMLEYLRDAYKNPLIYIDENGYGLGELDTFNDTGRIEYLTGYISSMLDAIRNGVNVKGYFVWSFLDVFEYLAGYTSRMGLYHVDFEDANLTRKPRKSAYWYSKFLKSKVDDDMKIRRNRKYATSYAQQ